MGNDPMRVQRIILLEPAVLSRKGAYFPTIRHTLALRKYYRSGDIYYVRDYSDTPL
ncbi:MAG: hypothetical protein IID13_01165 [Candidatus Marinimicrobia bacterium]|nr:hypothetical protein [Candidatus Neomarinimicrobiota bacterium]